MTILVCDFRSIVGDAVHGTVTIESAVDRPAQQIPGAVITPVREEYPLRDGQCIIDDIDPGPVVLELSAEGVFRRWEINIPEDGRHQFSTMLEDQVQWTPAILSQVQELNAEMARYAAAAGKSATAAKQAETRVAAVVADGAGALRVEIAGTLREVDERLAAAARMRDESRAAVVESTRQADRSEKAADRAAEDARAKISPLVEQSRVDRAAVEATAERVDASALAAAGDAAAAQDARGEAVDAATRAGYSEQAADRHRARAMDAADTVEASKEHIDAAEERVNTSRDTAVDAARRAESSADRVDVHEATSQQLGLVKLAGDLAGTAESPQVPRLSELDGKAEKTHGHDVSEVAGLSDALAKRALREHRHLTSQIDGLDGVLAGKADTAHKHSMSDVTGLSEAIAGRAERSHTHPTSQITGLDAALKAKAEQSHKHVSADISDSTGSISAANVGKSIKIESPSGTNDGYLWVSDNGVLYVNKGALVIASEAEGKQYGTPSEWHHITNKKYVDDSTQHASWSSSRVSFRDNGSIRLGSGGGETYKWRVDRGRFELYFDIRWGRNASSGGGEVKIKIPVKNASGIEAIGTGSYWSSVGNFGFVITPTVEPKSNEVKFLVAHHGDTSTMKLFRLWDGRNGSGTGIPGNPGFRLDENGSSIKGMISFPA